MDNVSSLECLKFDSQSEVLYKDGGGKDLLSPAMVPINFDTPITGMYAFPFKDMISPAVVLVFVYRQPITHHGIDEIPSANYFFCLSEAVESEADESETDESETDEFETDESEADESKADDLEADDSEADESETDESETDESEADDSETEKLSHECGCCLKVGDHFTELCPYRYHVPENAIVGKTFVVICHCCGCHFRDSRCSRCGGSDGFAILMNCLHCGNYGEHMTYMCPSRERSPHLCSL